MADKHTITIKGEVTFIKEHVNKETGKVTKFYTVAYLGGTLYSLFINDKLNLGVGDRGVFDVEIKASQLKDEKGYKKFAYVPTTIVDFASDVIAEIKAPRVAVAK